MALVLFEELQFFDNLGNPLAGGKIFTYAPATTTPKAVFTDATGVTEHANPVVLDASGRPPLGTQIWLNGAIKFLIKPALDQELVTVDNINAAFGSGGLTTRTTLTTTLAATSGAAVLTASGLVPSNRRLTGAWSKNLVALGTSQGLSGYDLGSHSLQDRWGTNIGFGLGTKTTVGNFQLSEQPVSNVSQDITVSALSGTFDGTGSIEITVEVESGTPL